MSDELDWTATSKATMLIGQLYALLLSRINQRHDYEAERILRPLIREVVRIERELDKLTAEKERP